MLVVLLVLLFALSALLLSLLSKLLPQNTDKLLDEINECLPQTQCAQCGYPGCRPYAQALLDGEAMDRCVPGGERTLLMLQKIFDDAPDSAPKPTKHKKANEDAPENLCVIIEEDCIGCTKCIQSCPVDAIIGAPKKMHIILQSECTGCFLCEDACPTLAIRRKAATPIQAHTRIHNPKLIIARSS